LNLGDICQWFELRIFESEDVHDSDFFGVFDLFGIFGRIGKKRIDFEDVAKAVGQQRGGLAGLSLAVN
jgi:hypothetical protein